MIKLFTAKTCEKCKQLKRVLDEQDYKHTVVSVDTQQGAAEAAEYFVRGLPTMIKFVDGSPVDILVDFKPDMLDAIDEFCKD